MQGFFYPDDVGAPIGEVGGPTVMLLEMHYDNPLKKTGAFLIFTALVNALETQQKQGPRSYFESDSKWGRGGGEGCRKHFFSVTL